MSEWSAVSGGWGRRHNAARDWGLPGNGTACATQMLEFDELMSMRSCRMNEVDEGRPCMPAYRRIEKAGSSQKQDHAAPIVVV